MVILLSGIYVFALCCPVIVNAQTTWQIEWEKTLAAAKKEGKVVVGIPPSAELRKELESGFKAKFGFELELFPATGPQIANRVVTEGKAGVRYFDTFIFGSCTAVPLIKTGLFDQAENYMILPEVKDPKQWWGGHVFMDNVAARGFSIPSSRPKAPKVTGTIRRLPSRRSLARWMIFSIRSGEARSV